MSMSMLKPLGFNATKIALNHQELDRTPRLEDDKKLTCTFIVSRLDYFNALYSVLHKRSIDRLQLLAARVLMRNRKRDHIILVLASLHWLPVSLRIDFYITLLVFKSPNGTAPSYISVYQIMFLTVPSGFLPQLSLALHQRFITSYLC